MFLLPVLLGPGYNYDYNISEKTECSNSSDNIPSSIKGSTYNHHHHNNNNNTSDCQSVPKNGYCLNYHHIRLNPKDRDDGIIFKWKSSSSSSSLATNALNMNMNGKVDDPINNNDEPIILLSGWLNKMKRRSKLYGDWNKRWVTLEHDCIVWRHGNNHTSNHIKETKKKSGGRIELAHVDSILVLKTHTKSSQKVFVIKSSFYQRNLCLMAKTSTDCDKWVRAIQLQMDLQSGGTFSGPACTKNHRRRSRTTNNTTLHDGIIGNSSGDKFDVRV